MAAKVVQKMMKCHRNSLVVYDYFVHSMSLQSNEYVYPLVQHLVCQVTLKEHNQQPGKYSK